MKQITFTQAVDLMIRAKRTENKSPRTLDNYSRFLKRFDEFLRARGGSTTLTEIVTDDIRAFVAHLQAKERSCVNHPFNPPRERPLSPHTIHTFVAALSALFKWCELEELIGRNPMDRIVRPKLPKLIKPPFSEEELKKLLAACDQYQPQLALRNKAIVYLLLSTGVRAAELCTLTLGDLDLDHERARVHGKGAKDREIFFRSSTSLAIARYITIARPDSQIPFVFLTERGDAIRPDRLTAILRDLGERAGVPRCSPHRFRHTSTRLHFRYGAREFAMQKAMGHEDLSTTRRYAALERVDVEEDLRRSDPVEHLRLR